MLCCSKDDGLIAIVRTINPSFLVDSSPSTIIGLVRFVKRIDILYNEKAIIFPENYLKDPSVTMYYKDIREYIEKILSQDK